MLKQCVFFFISFTIFLSGCTHNQGKAKNAPKGTQIPAEVKKKSHFDSLLEVNESLMMGQKNGRWYFVPIAVESETPDETKANEAFVTDTGPDYFSEGYARIIKDGRFGMINEKGEVVVAPIYDFAESFEDSYAVVCQGCVQNNNGEHALYEGGHWGMIDRLGKVVVPLKYESIEYDPEKKRAKGEKKGEVTIHHLP